MFTHKIRDLKPGETIVNVNIIPGTNVINSIIESLKKEMDFSRTTLIIIDLNIIQGKIIAPNAPIDLIDLIDLIKEANKKIRSLLSRIT